MIDFIRNCAHASAFIWWRNDLLKQFVRENGVGILIALAIAIAAYFLGKMIPVIGGPVLGISLGIMITSIWKLPLISQKGIKFTSKYI